MRWPEEELTTPPRDVSLASSRHQYLWIASKCLALFISAMTEGLITLNSKSLDLMASPVEGGYHSRATGLRRVGGFSGLP